MQGWLLQNTGGKDSPLSTSVQDAVRAYVKLLLDNGTSLAECKRIQMVLLDI